MILLSISDPQTFLQCNHITDWIIIILVEELTTKHRVQTSRKTFVMFLESETCTWKKSGNRFSMLEYLNMCLLRFINCRASCFHQFCCIQIPSFATLDDLVAQMVCCMACYLVCSVWCRTLTTTGGKCRTLMKKTSMLHNLCIFFWRNKTCLPYKTNYHTFKKLSSRFLALTFLVDRSRSTM